MAQVEREFNHQRQAEGIAAAKAKGVKFGREAIDLPEDFAELYGCWRSGELTAKQTAELCGVSVRTLYKWTEGMR